MLALCEYYSGMSKELPPSRTAEQFVVRFPDGMRNKIAEAAKSSNRSMNAEIVARLESTFSGFLDKDLTYQMLNAEVNRLTDKLHAERQSGNELMGKIQPIVEEHIEAVMARTGFTFSEALLLTVTRGAALETAAPVVIVQVAKDTTLAEAKALMRVFTEQAPHDASVFYEQSDISKTRLLSSSADKEALMAKADRKLDRK